MDFEMQSTIATTVVGETPRFAGKAGCCLDC